MLTCAILMVLVASPAAASPDFGVTARLPISDAKLKRMDAAGVEVLRLRMSWSQVASASGKRFHWGRIDDAVIGAADRGIEIIPYLSGRRWMGGSRARGHRKRGSAARPDRGDWKRFVSHAMARYGTRGMIWRHRGSDAATPIAITTWEVGMASGSTGGPAHVAKGKLKSYARLLTIAGHAAKKIDRGAEVAASVTVAQSRRGGARASTLARLLSTKAGKFIDAMTVRPPASSGRRLRRGIGRVRRSLDRRGLDDASIIIAPVGWSSDKRRSRHRSVGRRGQARRLRRSFKLIDRKASGWESEAVIWSAWRDRGSRGGGRGCRWCRKSGLLNRAGKVKPSLDAFERFAGRTATKPFDPSAGAFYGVAPGVRYSEADVRMMGEAGVGVARLVISWPALQPEVPGPIDWRGLDRLLESLAVQGIEPLPQFLGSPVEVGRLTADRLPQWRDFVSRVVARYGAQGAFWKRFAEEHPGLAPRPPEAWQVWNEQNNRGFWSPEPSPKEYAKLLHASAAAIRGSDPSAEVMLGGMYEYATWISATDYLRKLYAIPGTKADFDIVAVHPYAAGNAGIASQIESVRDQMDLFGEGGKDIWITEFGWASVPIDISEGGVYAELSRDEAGQAKVLGSAYEMLLANRSRWRLRGAIWYSWRDAREPACIFCQYTGLVRNDGSPKPSLAEFAALAEASAPERRGG